MNLSLNKFSTIFSALKYGLTYSVLLLSACFASTGHALDCSGIPQWNSTTAYSGGAKVQTQGSAYQANWWTQNQDPVTHSGDYEEWTNLGSCSTGGTNSSSLKSSSSSAKSSSSSKTASSTGTTSGGSCSSPSYSAGTSYNTGQLVQNVGNEYRCTVAGWCSSSGAWAYAPGTGSYWTQAWELVRACSGSGQSSSSVKSSSSSKSSSSKSSSSKSSSSSVATGDCGAPWYRANLTNYESYPDPGSEECTQYNGCTWAGQFYGVDGKQTEDWVKNHNIVAVHLKDWNWLGLKKVNLRQGTHKISAIVYDACSDSDCDGCCTQNLGGDGYLVDIEKYTMQRFGSGEGTVEFQMCP